MGGGALGVGAGGVTDGAAARGCCAPGGGGGALAIGPGAAGGGVGAADGLLADPGTNGGADDPGTNGGADGAVPDGGRDGTNAGGVADGYSGIPPVGDGGVAVAVIGPLSSRRRGGAGISAVRVGLGGAGGAVYGLGAAGGNGCGFCVDGVAAGGVVERATDDVGVLTPLGAGIVITPLQTEHRARTPFGGTFAGSTRKIERQSGQLTFIHFLRSCEHRVSPAAAPAA